MRDSWLPEIAEGISLGGVDHLVVLEECEI
jgi:hypothetical protein